MKTGKKIPVVFLLLTMVFFFVGCSNNDDTDTATPRSFLRTETTEEGEQYSSLYYIIDPMTEQVSVVNSIEDEFEYYDLENYKVTEKTINFVYDGIAIEMTLESHSIYTDSHGNTYHMKAPIEKEN